MTASCTAPLFPKIVLGHVVVLLLGSSWVFGGNTGWMRFALSLWASLALPLAIFGLFAKNAGGPSRRRCLLWLLPPLLYALLVVTSALNPTFIPVRFDDAEIRVPNASALPWLPGTVDASASLTALWFGAGVWLSAFNLLLADIGRRALRALFVLIAANAFVLSIFGTLQKLSGANLYFGASESPNARFFATFIYNNHWGAFMILALSAALGLLFHQARRRRGRDLWHSPFTAALLCALVIAATAPVSASRAATAMAGLLLLVAVARAFAGIISSRRREGRPFWPPVLALAVFAAAFCGAIGWLAMDSIRHRLADTRASLASDDGLLAGRAELYADSWKLVEQKPVFGWGLDSYGVAFQLVRPRSVLPWRQYERSYDTAHNDWLQSLTETGFAGTLLLLLTLALPLASLSHAVRHPLVACPLFGLSVVLAYALVEFPFSNGAVLILFSTLLFMVVRYAALIRTEARP